jgi:hypothetical protein
MNSLVTFHPPMIVLEVSDRTEIHALYLKIMRAFPEPRRLSLPKSRRLFNSIAWIHERRDGIEIALNPHPYLRLVTRKIETVLNQEVGADRYNHYTIQ